MFSWYRGGTSLSLGPPPAPTPSPEPERILPGPVPHPGEWKSWARSWATYLNVSRRNHPGKGSRTTSSQSLHMCRNR